MPAKKQTPIPQFEHVISSVKDTRAAVIRTATEKDFKFILDRSRKWTNEQGFIPAEGMRQLIEEGRGLVLLVNGDLAGYLLTSGGIRQPLVVRHNTISEDLWDQGLGTLLMRAVIKWSRWSGKNNVLVRTRVDITRQRGINSRLGGHVIATDPHIGRREKPVEIWSVAIARRVCICPPVSSPERSREASCLPVSRPSGTR